MQDVCPPVIQSCFSFLLPRSQPYVSPAAGPLHRLVLLAALGPDILRPQTLCTMHLVHAPPMFLSLPGRNKRVRIMDDGRVLPQVSLRDFQFGIRPGPPLLLSLVLPAAILCLLLGALQGGRHLQGACSAFYPSLLITRGCPPRPLDLVRVPHTISQDG